MPPVPTGLHRRAALLVAAPAVLALAVGAGFAAGRTTVPDGASTQAPATATAPATAAAGGGAPVHPARARSGLRLAGSCEELLDSYVGRGVAAVSAYGWQSPVWSLDATMPMTAQSGRLTGVSKAPATSRAASSGTGTNVQEEGVDEPDVVKTDGSLLVRVHEDVLEVHDVTGDEPELLGELGLARVREAEVLLAGDRVVVIGADRLERELWTRVLTVDVSDPASPAPVAEQVYEGSALAARLHGGPGGVVRLVVSPALPDLDFVRPHGRRSWQEARRANRQVVRDSAIGDWLPTVDGEPLLGCEDVAVPADDEATLGTVAVSAFTADQPAARTATAVAAGAGTAYFSADRLHLADSGWSLGPDCCLDVLRGPATRVGVTAADDGVTQLHAFALDGVLTTYVASGEVEGSVADRWSMDSVDGLLRVAVGPTRRTDDANSVVTLVEDGADLVEAGRLDGLGLREDIKAVRWFDDLAIVVTFRQVDPLYAVDLSDPRSPGLIGELKIPGFSEYLHPLGPRRMIGVGQDASRRGWTRGAQAALFGVDDLTDPRRLDVASFPRGSEAGAATDPRQFTWLPDRRTALTVVSRGWRGRVGWVSVLRVRDGRLASRLIEVEDGLEVTDVRTVALPSGEVVLVTDDGLSFLDLRGWPRAGRRAPGPA